MRHILLLKVQESYADLDEKNVQKMVVILFTI
jgi:hypothetical protein